MENNLWPVIAFTIFCYIIGFTFGYLANEKVDLPEEYTQISKNHHQPDTLIGFYMDDKLHIEFIPKK